MSKKSQAINIENYLSTKDDFNDVEPAVLDAQKMRQLLRAYEELNKLYDLCIEKIQNRQK